MGRMTKSERRANQKKWGERAGFGLRWLEIVISAFKHVFGESMGALLPYTAYIEIAIKIAAYNHAQDIRDRAVRATLRGGMTLHVPTARGGTARHTEDQDHAAK